MYFIKYLFHPLSKISTTEMSVYFSSYTNLLYVRLVFVALSHSVKVQYYIDKVHEREKRLCKTCKTDHLSQKKLNPLPNPALFLNCLRCFQICVVTGGNAI